MLKFLVYDQDQPAKGYPLHNAYLIGSGNVAMRSRVSFDNGSIQCRKREPGSAAMALQHRAGDCGDLTVQTCLLPERDDPYLLSLELARHRLMALYHRIEDWGMFDLSASHPVNRRLERAKKLFIEALCRFDVDPVRSDQLARECLNTAIDGSEELTLAHADLLLDRRRVSGTLSKPTFGCGVPLARHTEWLRVNLLSNFDFIYLPCPWRLMVPQEERYDWAPTDNWVGWARHSRTPVLAGPIISFDPRNAPDWLFIWEHDYERLRDLIYEHTESLVMRYRNAIQAWNVVSGLHVNSHFTFKFEQLMDLTRMTTMLIKKVQPAARAYVEICQPFGEYFARSDRSIPPLMYADLLIQNSIQFDGFVLKLIMGQGEAGQHTRDLMQISNLLDQFIGFAKPVHLVIAAPSQPATPEPPKPPDTNAPHAPRDLDSNGGYWRRPWSNLVQSRWLEALLRIALSKPFVESVVWQGLIDHAELELPHSGLVTQDLQPKPGLRKLILFRRGLREPTPQDPGQRPAGSSSKPPPDAAPAPSTDA